jgi:hypothetical protein
VQARLATMYRGRIEGCITHGFFDKLSIIWHREQDELLRKIQDAGLFRRPADGEKLLKPKVSLWKAKPGRGLRGTRRRSARFQYLIGGRIETAMAGQSAKRDASSYAGERRRPSNLARRARSFTSRRSGAELSGASRPTYTIRSEQ